MNEQRGYCAIAATASGEIVNIMGDRKKINLERQPAAQNGYYIAGTDTPYDERWFSSYCICRECEWHGISLELSPLDMASHIVDAHRMSVVAYAKKHPDASALLPEYRLARGPEG